VRYKIFGAAVLFVGLAQSSFGSIISNGNFAINGTIYVVNFGVDPDGAGPLGTCGAAGGCIDWQSGGSATLNVADISLSGLPNGDIPLAIAGNNAANIFNLTNPPDNVAPPVFFPQMFLTFANGGVTTQLDITTIFPGINGNPACLVGPQCTPAGSLFNFVNNISNQATATWAFAGVTHLPGQVPQSTWTGNFTSQFAVPYQTVLANLAANGFVSNTYSATITLTTVPEPGSLIIMGSGLIGLAGLLRRRIAK
jgi:hypothetical protein